MSVTKNLEDKIEELISDLSGLPSEAAAIEFQYFNAGVSGLVTAVANGGDAVTVTSKLTKDEMLAGITLVQQIKAFFSNSAVTQADYRTTALNIRYADSAAGAALSAATEDVGDRLFALSVLLLESLDKIEKAITLYNGSSIQTAFASVDDDVIVFGSDLTVGELKSAMTMLSELADLLKNAAVTQGDYATTLAKLQRTI